MWVCLCACISLQPPSLSIRPPFFQVLYAPPFLLYASPFFLYASFFSLHPTPLFFPTTPTPPSCLLAQAAKPTERHWHCLPFPPAGQHLLRHKSKSQSCAHIPLREERSWVAAPAFFPRIWPSSQSSVSNTCHDVPHMTAEQQNSPDPNPRLNPDFPCTMLLKGLHPPLHMHLCALVRFRLCLFSVCMLAGLGWAATHSTILKCGCEIL